MAQMAIRPPQFWINPLGSLAEEYSVYIGKPNEDATQPSSQITLMDGLSGAAIAQPFIITNGIARNTQGQQVLPTITATRYSIKFVDNDGVEVYAEEDFFSDAFGLDQEAALTADRILDSLQDALVTDLTDLNYIFCKSENAGWEASLPGPDLNTYFFYTGEADAGKAGTKETDSQGGFSGIFYDSVGNQWKIVPQPYVNATGLIDQSIDGRKRFLSNTRFSALLLVDNSKPITFLTPDNSVDGELPGTVRTFLSSSFNFITQQRNEAGDDWRSIQELTPSGTNIIRALENIFTNSVALNTDTPLIFRNSGNFSENEGAYRIINKSDNSLRIEAVNSSGSYKIRFKFFSGGEAAFYDENGSTTALIDNRDVLTPKDVRSVITAEKGDARYLTQTSATDNYLTKADGIERNEVIDLRIGVGTSNPSGWTKTESVSGDVATFILTPNVPLKFIGNYQNVQCVYNDIFDSDFDQADLFPILSKAIIKTIQPFTYAIEIKAHKAAIVQALVLNLKEPE